MLRAVSVLVKDSVLYSSSGTLRCHDQPASWVRLPCGQGHCVGGHNTYQPPPPEKGSHSTVLLKPERWEEAEWVQACVSRQGQEGPEGWVLSSHCGRGGVTRHQALVTNAEARAATAGDKHF